ncbi:MAG: hypothetical protein H0W13_12245 [Nitrospirales bacterium]|nr:hypothetical protein [Nitrospirales bacterium]
MSQLRQYSRILTLVSALMCALILPRLVHAGPILVDASVSINNGLFHYNYGVTNNSPLDLSVVTISLFSSPLAIQNLVAPTGFNTNFDVRLGLLDFLENTRSFTMGTTVSGFQFDSPFGPNTSSFTALALNSNGGLISFAGQTLAPQVTTPVPEPSTFVLALTSGMLLIGGRRFSRVINSRRTESRV